MARSLVGRLAFICFVPPAVTFSFRSSTFKSSLLSLLSTSTSSLSDRSRHQILSPAFMSSNRGGSDAESQGQADFGGNNEEATLDNTLQPWRERIQTSSTNSRYIRGSNYVQLATVDREGQPHCRTVVFRGFLQDALLSSSSLIKSEEKESLVAHKNIMAMTTDARSPKVADVGAHKQGAAELVWWFPQTTEQYRVAGKIVFVAAHGVLELQNNDNNNNDTELKELRQQQWEKMSDAAKLSFFAKGVPGAPYKDDEHDGDASAEASSKQNIILSSPPDNFLLMLMVPKRVDYLRLTKMYRQLDVCKEDGSWYMQRVHP